MSYEIFPPCFKIYNASCSRPAWISGLFLRRLWKVVEKMLTVSQFTLLYRIQNSSAGKCFEAIKDFDSHSSSGFKIEPYMRSVKNITRNDGKNDLSCKKRRSNYMEIFSVFALFRLREIYSFQRWVYRVRLRDILRLKNDGARKQKHQ